MVVNGGTLDFKKITHMSTIQPSRFYLDQKRHLGQNIWSEFANPIEKDRMSLNLVWPFFVYFSCSDKILPSFLLSLW